MTTQVLRRAEHEFQPAVPMPADHAGDGAIEAAPRRANPGERPWSRRHPVNVRLTVPLPFLGRCYLTVVAGRERRSPERLAVERRKHPLRTAGNVIFAFAVGSVIGLALLTAVQLAIVAFVGGGDSISSAF